MNLKCRSFELWANECVNFICPCRNALPDLHPDPPGSSQCEAPNNGTGWGGLDLSQARRGHHQRFTQRSGSSCVPEVTLRLHSVRGRTSGDVCGDGGSHKPSRWVSVRPCWLLLLHTNEPSNSLKLWELCLLYDVIMEFYCDGIEADKQI